MRTRLLLFTVIACFATSGCAPRYSITVVGPPGAAANAELTIQQLLVRYLVAEASTQGAILVSFGESRLDNVDPPAAFFDRCADLKVALKPASQYDAPHHPNALLLMVYDVEMTSDTEASVVVTRYRYAVGASDGFTAGVQWHDGAWRIVRKFHLWSR